MKKKVISIMFCVCLIMSFAARAFAEERALSADEVSNLYQDAVKSCALTPIEISDYYISKMNSAGKVDIKVRWSNHSGKTIKYLYLIVVPYNDVGDIVKSDVGNITARELKAVGPCESVEPDINISDFINGDNYLYSIEGDFSYRIRQAPLKLHASYKDIYFDGQQAYFYGGNGYGNDGQRYDLNPADFRKNKYSHETKWEGVWYGKTITRIEIQNIKIEYMDGTIEEVNPAAAILGYQYRQKSLRISPLVIG